METVDLLVGLFSGIGCTFPTVGLHPETGKFGLADAARAFAVGAEFSIGIGDIAH
jgi:uncharacterized Ntn-hydrolase superfamily protein